jgi:transcriptional regulator with PAS, ATPase and Fis domain
MAINLSKSYYQPTLNIRTNERHIIECALHRNKGNRKASASELGITERTLYRKLNEFNLHNAVSGLDN